jgi:hypothetical protein
MKKQTAQLALDVLTSLDSTLEFMDWENGDGEKIGEQLREAIAALEADIAQAVEPVAWIDGDCIVTFGQMKCGFIDRRDRAIPDSWKPLYATPPEPTVNSDLLRVLKEASNALGGIKLDGLPNNATGRIVCAIAYVERAMEKATS